MAAGVPTRLANAGAEKIAFVNSAIGAGNNLRSARAETAALSAFTKAAEEVGNTRSSTQCFAYKRARPQRF